MTGPLQAVIVDDEAGARADLQRLLTGHSRLRVAGEAECVEQAVKVIRELEPDVVFLDTEMPGRSGFELLEQVEATFKLVFVTTSGEHAVRAFEANAVDYLLKPVHPDRLRLTIRRLMEQDAAAPVAAPKKLDYDGRLFVTMEDRSEFLRISRIKCIQSAGDYSEVLTTDSTEMLVPIPLREWEERLPEKYFARIHRSAIVNLEYVERLEKWFNYTYHIYLRDLETPLSISRRYVAQLKERYG